MKKIWILLIVGCTATKIPAPAPTVLVYTNLELTIRAKQDSIRISNLEKMVVMLDTAQWSKSGNTVTMKGTDSLTVGYLMVTGIKKDTTNPHDGNDTLIHAPN